MRTRLSFRDHASFCRRSLTRVGLPAAWLALWTGWSWAQTAHWATFNKDYRGQRYSELTQITAKNVAGLRPVCEAHVGDRGTFQAGPLVIGSVMFITTAHTTVALEAATCRILWQNIYVPEEKEVQPINRGVAYAAGRVYRGTADGRLLALDAGTGKEIWRIKAANPRRGEAFNSAPIVWNGLLYTGIVNSDFGVRGRMMAYDVKDGHELWRFNLVPSKGEPGYETWRSPGSAERGGGGTWSTYTLDPTTGEIFIPVGNPSPAYDPESRAGENFYTDSVVVLDARTGRYHWHFQLDSAEGLDRDLAAAPVLYTDRAGHRRVAAGSKDGYLYSIDRDTHRLLWKVPVTTVMEPTPAVSTTPTRICPGMFGGVEWNGPAFDPQRQALYVGSIDACDLPFTRRQEFKEGKLIIGGGALISTESADLTPSGWVSATDATTGQVRWRYHADSPVTGAVTATAGGIIFAGESGGNLLALDADNGKLLLKYASGGALAGGVVTYEIGGRQLVAFLSGNVSRGVFYNIEGDSKVVMMALGVRSKTPVITRVPQDGARPNIELSVGEVAFRPYTGQRTYNRYCATCHGASGDGGIGPALRGVLEQRKDKRPPAQIIKDPKSAIMPRLYPNPLSDDDVAQIVEFLESWK